LSSAFLFGLVPNKKHMATKALAKEALCRVFFLALGKEASLPSVFF